jgi:hypothetical protein
VVGWAYRELFGILRAVSSAHGKKIDGSFISILLFVGDDDDNDTVAFDWMTQMLMLLLFSLCWLT